MGVSVVTIGGLVGVFIAATLTQWYYTKRYGADGLACFRSDRPTSTLDLGWGAAQIHEITQDIHDISSRARTLEHELVEVQLTRNAMAKARLLGQEGQLRLNELKKMKVVRRGLSKRILGGLGHKVHHAATRLKIPFRTLLHDHAAHDDHLEAGLNESVPEHDYEHEEGEEETELRLREAEIQAELTDLSAEKDLLERIKVSET